MQLILLLIIPDFNQYQISIRLNDFRIVNYILLIKRLLSKLAEILPILQNVRLGQ